MALTCEDLHAIKELFEAGFESNFPKYFESSFSKYFEAGISPIKADLEYIKSDLEAVKSDLDAVKNDLDIVKVDLEAVKKSQFIVENVWFKKINASLEGFENATMKNAEQDKRLDDLETTVDRHDLLITALKTG